MSFAYPTPDTEDKKAQLITEYLKKQLDAIGFRVTLVPYEIQTLAEAYNQGTIEEGIDAYYIGNNFEITHDLKSFFREGNKDDYEKGSLLWTHAYLNELSSMANKTEPEDLFGYMEKWVRLQEEISVYLPVLPVYGNVYVDIYTKNLRNYEIKKYTTWSKAIMDSYFSEPEDNDEDQSGNDELLNALDKDN
jgi:ABC-type transport system substrate-binding protein